MFTNKIIEIFCQVDDFCQVFEPQWKKLQLSDGKKHRNRKSRLSQSEVMTIVILFHLSGYRTFKDFYLKHICVHYKKWFPDLVSYNRFIELKQKTMIPLALFLKMTRMGKCTGISFIDSTPIRTCHNRRIHQHKVFKDIAERGHCSVGYFYGFKLHIIVSDSGELLDFVITKANVDDRKPLRSGSFAKKLFGKLFGDKGYISKDLFEFLFLGGVQLITKLRKNMKGQIMDIADSINLRKRAIVETIYDQLKNISQIEHTRHRSLANFFINIFAGLTAYTFQDKKPSVQIQKVQTNQLALF